MINLIVPLFIGTTELLLMGGLALLLFGGKKLPEVMKGLGQGIKQFKQGMNEVTNEEDKNETEVKDNVESRTSKDDISDNINPNNSELDIKKEEKKHE